MVELQKTPQFGHDDDMVMRCLHVFMCSSAIFKNSRYVNNSGPECVSIRTTRLKPFGSVALASGEPIDAANWIIPEGVMNLAVSGLMHFEEKSESDSLLVR